MTRSMLRSLRPLALGLLALLALCVPAASAQSTRTQILRDCEDNGRLDGTYNPSEIRDARNNIPDDVDEYSNCRDVLSRATLSNAGGSTGGRPAARAAAVAVAGPVGPARPAAPAAARAPAAGPAVAAPAPASAAAQRPRLRPPPPHPRSCASSRPPCSTPASHAWWTAAGSP